MKIGQLIGGEWVQAGNGGTRDVINPATEEVVATVPFGNADDCNTAIKAAAEAFNAWARQTPYERGAILDKAAARIREQVDDLARITVQEAGKPIMEAAGEWRVVADLLEWFAEEGKRAYGRTIPSRFASKRMTVLKQPIGVVGVITAWNFPAYNPGRAWAAALAAGCTVVARTSEYTPLTAMALANALHESGIPAGVLNLVHGESSAIGQAMLDHEACRKISFTGGVRVGRILMDGASKTFTRLGLELGGNAPVLIFPDVDVDAVAKAAVSARFRNAGQVCVAPQRFLVQEKIASAFTDRLASATRKLAVGNGLDPATRVGPLINVKQREHVEALVKDAKACGARVLAGGKRPEHLDKGYFYEPTVISGVQPDMPVYAQEIFGPVLPVASFDDIDRALTLANDTPYGLAAYVWTNDLKTAIRASEGLDFGMVGVNEWAPHGTEAPFGGRKHSGLGHESGAEGLLEYMETKLVTIGGL
jgi:succinate-semialdehyde dehydrogenase/glutarate-semialdehyde dehydrogenase